MFKSAAIAMAASAVMLATAGHAEMAYFAHDGRLETVASMGQGREVAAGTATRITSMGDARFGASWNIEFTGTMELSQAEELEFSVSSDDGSALFIDGKAVVMNDGAHGNSTRKGKINLPAGRHQVNLLYFNRGGGHSLSATVTAATGQPRDLASACTPSEERQNVRVVTKAVGARRDSGGAQTSTAKGLAADPEGMLALSSPEALVRSITHILKTKPREYRNGRDYLEQAQHFAEIMPEVLEKLAAGDAEAAKTIDAFNALKFTALVADNPYMDFDEILVVLTQKLATKSNWLGTHVIDPKGHDSKIARMSLRTGEITSDVYVPGDGAYLGEIDLHFDGDKLLFTSTDANSRYQVMEVGVDGAGTRQVSSVEGEFVNNYGGIYLPNGRIVFSSTAPMVGVPCIGGKQAVPNLYVMDADGGNTRQLTFEQDADWYPSVLPDGKIMYLRWEYTDIMHYYSRIMMTMNPDGTNQRAIYGSQSLWPNSMFYARPLPGAPGKFSAVISGHHGLAGFGKLTIFDTNKGFAHADGVDQYIPGYGKEVTHVTVDQLYPTVKKELLEIFPDLQEVVSKLIEEFMPNAESSGADYHELNNEFFNKCYPKLRDYYPQEMALDLDRLADGMYPLFYQPYPVSAEYFLANVQLSADDDWGLYLVDKFDNFVPVNPKDTGYRYAIEPQPLRKRERPPVIPDRVNLQDKEAVCYVQNVYRGPGLAGVPEGVVDSLRVFTYAYGYYMTGSHYHLGVESGWDVKRILGTVKVEEDGSAMFKIPANTTVSLQPLDEEGRAIQLFRSWLVAMPGEELSCIGCHESPAEPPVSARSIAALKPPQRIVPRRGRVEGFSFDAEIQPILDTHCVRCHDGTDARKPNFKDTSIDKPSIISANFSNSYYAFHKYFRRPGPESSGTMLIPYEYHASTSEGIQLLEKGHHGVNLDEDSWERLYTWIDMNVPFYGSWSSAYSADDERAEWTADIAARAAELRALYASVASDWEYTPIEGYPVVAPASKGPEKSDPIDVSAKNWPFDENAARAMQKDASDSEKRILNLGDGLSITMVRVPAGEFIMGSDGDSPQEQPRHKVQIGRAFWMSENEITNELYMAFKPDHNTGVFDQQWKDHVRLGYYASYDKQPAVRMSWNDANAFCAWLGEKASAKVFLPTEAQWEWACRAGSDLDMAFGSKSADFSTYANLADKSIQKYAVRGVNPTFSEKNAGDPTSDFVPRIAEIDDKQFLVSGTKQYQPNTWGLYDMHGNVAEWTRSDYVAYPYQESKSNSMGSTIEKVVRGGSFQDRPYRATSSYRLGYAPWQGVFNVGFRVVMED